MRIVFIKDHAGQQKKAGDEMEIEDNLGKHLIRFGYAESGLQRHEGISKKAGKNVEKQEGDNDTQSNA